MVATASVAMIAVNTPEANNAVGIVATLTIGGIFVLGVNGITDGKLKKDVMIYQ